MSRYVVIVVLVLLAAGCGAGTKTAPEVAGYVRTYLQAHPDVMRVVTKGTQKATVVIKGQEQDISADLGEDARGRLIHTSDAAYMQMLGEEVAPGKTWDKVTEEHEPYNLIGIYMLTTEAMKLADSHRVHELLAVGGRVSGPDPDGGLDRYTIAIDVRAALDAMDLDAFLKAYDPEPMRQDAEDEYAAVRSGDRAAQERLRGKLLDEFGPRATYELWLDDQGRPVRHRLAAKTPVDITFSHWDDTTVTAPPSAEVRILTR